MKSKRSFLLWLVCFVFLFAAMMELLKAINAVSSWNILAAVQYQPGPLYPFFFGTFFFLSFLASTLLLWFRLPWAAEFAGVAALLFTAWFWLDKFVVAVNPQPFSDQVFNLIVYIFILALMLASLWVLKPHMRPLKDEDRRNQ